MTNALTQLPRGTRNNNPGNIRHGDDWNGMSAEQPDKSFIHFDHLYYGVRAAAIILRVYQVSHRLRSVHKIISRWAPPIENDTGSYVRAVARSIKGTPEQQQAALLKAIFHHENGGDWVGDSFIEAGVRAAWAKHKLLEIEV